MPGHGNPVHFNDRDRRFSTLLATVPSWPLSDIESDRHEPPALGLMTRRLRLVELLRRYGHGIRFQDQMGAHMPTPMPAPSALYPFASICTRVWSLVVKR
jgi:hypothetical protein